MDPLDTGTSAATPCSLLGRTATALPLPGRCCTWPARCPRQPVSATQWRQAGRSAHNYEGQAQSHLQHQPANCAPDGDIRAADVAVRAELDAVLGDGDDHRVTDAAQVPAQRARQLSSLLPASPALLPPPGALVPSAAPAAAAAAGRRQADQVQLRLTSHCPLIWSPAGWLEELDLRVAAVPPGAANSAGAHFMMRWNSCEGILTVAA